VQLDVHQRYIRLALLHKLDGFFAGGGGAHDLDIRPEGEKNLQPLTD
jgi:hypothetical protein